MFWVIQLALRFSVQHFYRVSVLTHQSAFHIQPHWTIMTLTCTRKDTLRNSQTLSSYPHSCRWAAFCDHCSKLYYPSICSSQCVHLSKTCVCKNVYIRYHIIMCHYSHQSHITTTPSSPTTMRLKWLPFTKRKLGIPQHKLSQSSFLWPKTSLVTGSISSWPRLVTLVM